MSSGQVYPAYTGAIHPESLPDVTPGLVSTEWYAPSSVCLSFEMVVDPSIHLNALLLQ